MASCPVCEDLLPARDCDLAFLDGTGREHLRFAIPANLCPACGVALLDEELLVLTGISRHYTLINAIESDHAYRARAFGR